MITEGMHPQYDLFKQWAAVKRPVLEERLSERYIMYGEWMYARHSIHYRQLSHYFFEFDMFDRSAVEHCQGQPELPGLWKTANKSARTGRAISQQVQTVRG